MMYGFDYAWWSHWSERAAGLRRRLRPRDPRAPGSRSRTSTCCSAASCRAGLFAARGRPAAASAAGVDPRDPRRSAPPTCSCRSSWRAACSASCARPRGRLDACAGCCTAPASTSAGSSGCALLVLLVDGAAVRRSTRRSRAGPTRRRARRSRSARRMAWLLGPARAAAAGAAVRAHGVGVRQGDHRARGALERRAGRAVRASRFCLRDRCGRGRRTTLAVAALGVALLAAWTSLDRAWATTGYTHPARGAAAAPQAFVAGAHRAAPGAAGRPGRALPRQRRRAGGSAMTVPHAVDAPSFRQALAQFATGVTVVTTRDAAGGPLGLTVSAFCSVSLDPPLVLVCVDARSEAHAGFRERACSAVSVLAEDQEEVSRRFACARAGEVRGLRPRDGRDRGAAGAGRAGPPRVRGGGRPSRAATTPSTSARCCALSVAPGPAAGLPRAAAIGGWAAEGERT